MNKKDEIFENELARSVKELDDMLLEVEWDHTDFEEIPVKSGIADIKFSKEQLALIDKITDIIPDWKRVLNCRQHATHDFCLDLHTLLVIKKIKENQKYKDLNKINKLKILYSALLHDIEKNENEVDPLHPAKSAEKASEVLYKLGFSDEFINDVYILIRNHPILGLTAGQRIPMNCPKLADEIKNAQNLELLEIMSIADIKSVKKNEAFFKPEINLKIDEIVKQTKNCFKITNDNTREF